MRPDRAGAATIGTAVLEHACCANRGDDARVVAEAIADRAPAGRLLDIGCGSGAISLTVLASRPDIDAVGIDVSGSLCRAAEREAHALGVSGRFRALTGSAFDVDLPRLRTVAANPPMLPTEPGFAFSRRDGRVDLFWMRLIEAISGWGRPVTLWLHLFEFQGVGKSYGAFPSLAEVAAQHGFRVETVHHGWRSVSPRSSIRKALPALRRTFPEGRVAVGSDVIRFADLASDERAQMRVPHSVLSLSCQ